MDLTLIVIILGGFCASFINAAFATGGIYIMLAATSSVLPLTVAVPLQSVLVFSSLVARLYYFWREIQWKIVLGFGAGSVIGVAIGARVFTGMTEAGLALLLGILLLVLIWLPVTTWKIPLRHPFFPVGIAHSFIGTIFGVGALLQPSILRTNLNKLQITGTLAACLITMDVFKIAGYAGFGFNYLDYLPHIVAGSLAGIAGTWAGKRITHRISEAAFRIVFKTLITVVAFRFIYKGLVA